MVESYGTVIGIVEFSIMYKLKETGMFLKKQRRYKATTVYPYFLFFFF